MTATENEKLLPLLVGSSQPAFQTARPRLAAEISNAFDMPTPASRNQVRDCIWLFPTRTWCSTLAALRYPQGLKGDAILLEARILAVADLIEAMSSHHRAPHRDWPPGRRHPELMFSCAPHRDRIRQRLLRLLTSPGVRRFGS